MTDAVSARDALAEAITRAGGITKTVEKRPLYVHRKLLNPAPLLAWAKDNGIVNPMPASELHVTVTYSREPVDWLDMGQAWTPVVEVHGGPRMLQRFGDALVLAFSSYDLEDRNAQMRERGASFDFPQYRPHVTISYLDPDVDVEALKPYPGLLRFGPEIFEPIDDDWKASAVGKADRPSDPEKLPTPSRRLYKRLVARGEEVARGAIHGAGWREDGEGGWRRIDPRGERVSAARASLELAEALAKYKGQPRVPSGPKGGQWASTAGFGGPQGLTAPQLGVGGEARDRFEAAPEQAAFVKPLTESEITGEPAFLGNPYGYVLHEPSKASDPAESDNPEAKATFTVDADPGPGLNGVPFEPWAGPPGGDWTKVGGTGDFAEPPMPSSQKRIGAGVLIEEPDGRVWTVNPLNGFGGYTETFPKGGLEPGLNLRQTAIKEAFEETGLRVELTGVVGDFERTTSFARYYRARRIGGDPTAFHWETQSTNLVPRDDLALDVTHHADKPIIAHLSGANETIIKALCIMADMIDMGLDSGEFEKKKGGAWKKQMRVPAGAPTGGQWTIYGSGAIGAAAAHLGKPLALQKHGGTGPQSEQLNAHIASMEAYANHGVLSTYAQKLIHKPEPAQTYSAAAWASAKEAQAYIAAKAGKPAPAQVAPAALATPGMMKLAGMTKVGPKPGGSSAGAVFQDADGAKWLVKSYDTELMARNEVAAAKAYSLLGVETPEMHLIDIGAEFKGSQTNGIAVASKFMDGLTPFNPSDPAHLAAAQKDFGAHALLANWDAVGLSYDNLLLNPATGNAVMIDPGGSLLMRAMGKPKGEAFGASVPELDTLRDPKVNPTSAKVFGPMTQSQIVESVSSAALAWQASGNGAALKALGPTGKGGEVLDKLDARSDWLLAKANDMGAGLAATTAMDATKTGIVKPTVPEHVDPKVKQQAAQSEADLAAQLQDIKVTLQDVKSKFADSPGAPGAAKWYQKKVDELTMLALKGDVAGVQAAFYEPTKASTKVKGNYQNYLAAHVQTIVLAETVAAQNLKAGTGGLGEGNLLTGAANVSAAQLGAAKLVAGDSPLDKPSLATVDLIQPVATKPAPAPALSVPAAIPQLPKLSSPANANLKLVAKAEQMKAIAESGGEGAAAQIQAIALGITGTNSFNKKAKSYAADLIAALGGQASIDAMPTAQKAAALDAGLQVAAKITTSKTASGEKVKVKDYGSFELKEMSVRQHQTVVEQLPPPQSYTNWQGGNTGLSSKPEINKANEAIEQSIFAAAQKADADPAGALAAVQAIDPGPSKHPKAYKAHIISLIEKGPIEQKIITSSELITKEGGAVKPGEVAKALAEQVAIPQNFKALGHQKFYQHVLGAKVDPAIARALYDAIPDQVISTQHKVTQQLWDASNALGATHKAALYGHVGTNAASGKSWSAENNALRNGDVGTTTWAGAIKKAKLINESLTDIPEGVVVSRKISHGSAKEWAARAGQVMNDPGINSTAVASSGGGYIWSGGVQLRMKFVAGAQAAYVGPAKGRSGSIGAGSENELMLPRNTKWLIVGERTPEMKKDDPFSKGNTTGTIIDVLVLPHDPPE